MQNYPTFRGLLRSAICTQTQAQFANESGISAEHLSRMLNLDTIHRPTKATLHKIAAAAKNGITFQHLMEPFLQGRAGYRKPPISPLHYLRNNSNTDLFGRVARVNA